MNGSRQKVYTYPRRKIPGAWLSLDQSHCSNVEGKVFFMIMASGSHKDRVHIGRKFHSSSIKAFLDDITLVMNQKQAVQRSLDKMNDLLEWCRMSFKPAKSRSLALTWGKIRSDVFFLVAGQRILTVQEEPVKSLGRVFDETLKDRNQETATWKMMKESLDAIGGVFLPGRFKVWLVQFVLTPRLMWPLTTYEIGLPTSWSNGEVHQQTYQEMDCLQGFLQSPSIAGAQKWKCCSGPLLKSSELARSECS